MGGTLRKHQLKKKQSRIVKRHFEPTKDRHLCGTRLELFVRVSGTDIQSRRIFHDKKLGRQNSGKSKSETLRNVKMNYQCMTGLEIMANTFICGSTSLWEYIYLCIFVGVYLFVCASEKRGMVGGRGGSMVGGRDHKFGNSLPCGGADFYFAGPSTISYSFTFQTESTSCY